MTRDELEVIRMRVASARSGQIDWFDDARALLAEVDRLREALKWFEAAKEMLK